MKLAVIIVTALVLAGCGGAQSTQTPGANDCTIYAQGNHARITLAPGDKGECDVLIRDLSLGGALWGHTTTVPPDGTLGIGCDVFRGPYEAVVQDAGEQLSGRDACQMFTTDSWTGQQQLGPLAKQLEKQQQAVMQAQASQQAAQKRDQQISGLRQRLTGDISKLAHDTAAVQSNTSLAADVQKMRGDLANEQGEYVTVQHDSCTVRAGDVDRVQGGSDMVDGDADTAQGDISSLQANPVSGDVSAVRAVVRELRNLGASPATKPSAAVAAGNKALKDLDGAIASARQQSSGLDGTADQLAQEAGTLAAQCP